MTDCSHDPAICPACGSPDAEELGTLGVKPWVRCRACGTDYTVEPAERPSDLIHDGRGLRARGGLVYFG